MPTSSSKKKQLDHEAKRNNPNSPGTRAAKVRHDFRVETPITLPATASASADSLPTPAGGDTTIPVHAPKADPVESVDNPVDRHTQDTTTPSKSLSKDMHDEDGPGPKDAGVTFNDTGSDRGVSAVKSEPAITSIISDPLLTSRRSKARNKSNGRTSESFTRSDQAYTRWENFIYDSLFTDMPSGDSTATVAFTLASGRHIKIGETLDKPLIEGHIKQLRADLTFGQKEAILSEYLKPPDKSKRTINGVLPHPSRRHRNLNEDDNRSMSSIGTENSNLSKQSDNVSQHSGKFNTPDLNNRDEPMQSPIRLEEGHFIHRREHINSAQHANMRPVVTTPGFFRQEASTTELDSVTLIDKRRPFIHTASNPYLFEEVTWQAFRIMMCDCVAHWRGGPRLEDIILWSCWTPAFRKDFLKLWQAQCADSIHHPHRKNGMYIELYGHFDEQHFASVC